MIHVQTSQDGHTLVAITTDPERIGYLMRAIGRQAANPNHPMTWHAAAILSQKLRKARDKTERFR